MEIDSRQLLKEAYRVALKSPDPSTQNAALLVTDNGTILSAAYNCFPNNVLYTPERLERPLKYKIIEHAERNSIYTAARHGISTSGLTMVCPWAACTDCARGIIQAGIKRLITHKQAGDRSPDFWRQEIDIANQMLSEAGVEILSFDGEVGFTKTVLHSGQRWSP